MMTNIVVIGVPEDGCPGLTSRAVNAVSQARVVAGHPRHRQWFPQFEGPFLDMTQGFSTWLNQVIEESEEGGVAVLASGDPLFFGIGATLLKKLPASELSFIPTLSSAHLAFTRLGLPWHDACYLSCHGRRSSDRDALHGLVARMQQGSLFAMLTDTHNTPRVIARHLQAYGDRHWTLTVCEQLGSPHERITAFSVDDLAQCETVFDPLNMLVAQRGSEARWGGHGQFAGDDSFLKRMPQKGLITKQAVRHLALTALRIQPEQTVWDVGSGSGSIAIEAAKMATRGQVFAVECNPACFDSLQANCFAHGTDNVQLITGSAPGVLSSLSAPNAVFVGGSRGAMAEILSQSWAALQDGGRLVVSAVTMDTVSEVYQWAKANQLPLDAQVINISNTRPLAHYQRYQAENPIHLFSFIDKKVPLYPSNLKMHDSACSRKVQFKERECRNVPTF
ncbi:bifunctional cobalt-precorrin-7 (C(5))-methyltransferase/cobalt-precorrin-6B (C(15))-methyltransferase [Vibrio quintilis]|uniref:Precorrin-6Y C(5,15)-methyltransferase [decarboxylating] n=1 Tax=Vibrio quintilis TaxID=1117707 RepID=A0A1M7YQ70_9VIBR|nr:bifunctional cobalt-precorrin-7 (C(5))-methyltransferase/cobalt-precorrin-6B (C(15))-methyltransferase [Vibrio quintilis]SHO54656.1 Precorrin-6Y C(5,15)-methyltransferase [decarboxylating] [Vibrio quintilis]